MSTTPARAGFRSLSRKDWKAFAAAWIGYLLDGFDFVIITLVLTEVIREFHLSLVVGSTLVSAAFVTRWFGGLVLGGIGDRFGRKPAMVISILCFSLGSFLCGFAWNYWSLFIFRGIVGMGMAGEYGSSATYAMESWPKTLRNRASGALLSAYPIGIILASQLYAVIVPHFGWRWMFWIGLIPAALALVMREGIPEAAQWKQDVGEHRTATTIDLLFRGRARLRNVVVAALTAVALIIIFSGNSGSLTAVYAVVAVVGFVVFAVQMSGRLWPMQVMLMITVMAAFLYSWPIQSLLPTYLKSDLGYDPGTVSAVLSWSGLGYAAGSVLSGMLGDRLGTRRAYVVGLLVSFAFVIPVFLIGGGSVALLSVLLFALQLTSQGISGLLPKYISDHFPTRTRAAGLGFTYNVGALGGALAPMLGAQLAQAIGSLGHSIMFLSGGVTVLMILLIGLDVAGRVGRAIDRGQSTDTPALALPARTERQGAAR